MLIPQEKMKEGEWGVVKMTKEEWDALVKRASNVQDKYLEWQLKQPLNRWGRVANSRNKPLNKSKS